MLRLKEQQQKLMLLQEEQDKDDLHCYQEQKKLNLL
jgi:hypothetical protein